MNQARVLDTSHNYGKGGLSWATIYANFDGIIPRYGVGTGKDTIYDATIAELRRSGFPYQTYFIFARPALCGMSIREQANRWLAAPGAMDAKLMVDVEPPVYGRDETMVKYDELALAFEILEQNHPHPPTWYSNARYMNLLSWPRFLQGYNLLAAQYPWEPWKFREYLDYPTFLRDHAGKLPAWVRGTIYAVCTYGWQFTAHGRTPCVGQTVNGWSKKDHDFSVSTIDRDVFMSTFWTGGAPVPPTPPPPPEEEVIMTYQVISTDGLNLRTEPSTVGGANTVKAIWPYLGILTGTGRVSSVTGNLDTWVQVQHPAFGPLWAALVHGGKRYLKTL